MSGCYGLASILRSLYVLLQLYAQKNGHYCEIEPQRTP